MAWAGALEGPYHLYKVGSGFQSGNREVLDLGPEDRIDIGNSITIKSHIASPDVHVDDNNKRIIMYFHGPVVDPSGQRNFVSTSPDGLSFIDSVLPVILGGSYFKVIEYKDTLYSIDNRADIYKGGTEEEAWIIPPDFNFKEGLWDERDDNPFQDDINQDPMLAGTGLQVRHVGVHVSEDTLIVFYSRIGDAPERIMLSTIRLDHGTYNDWDPSYPPLEILHPEYDWEGYFLPNLPSEGCAAKDYVNQLRDPDVFEDKDGSLYLLYSGKGEDAIGLARLERTYGNPVSIGPVQYAFKTPRLKILGESRTGTVMFRMQSVSQTGYQIRIYTAEGRLVNVLKGNGSTDGSAEISWVPGSRVQGIYIANLITGNHSISVKFIY